jgi:hypothetical protein
VFVLFGPHVAINAAGELGKYRRTGQTCDSDACGAVLAAYRSHRAAVGVASEENVEVFDLEQSWLRRRVEARYVDIAASEEPLQALALTTYETIEDSMLAIVNHEFGEGKLIMLGGIQVLSATAYLFFPLYLMAYNQIHLVNSLRQ